MSMVPDRKSARRTVSGEPASHASTSRTSKPDSEVESAMNHRRRRATLRDPNFYEEAFNAFNSGDVYIRAAQGGLARATDQYVKDIRVRKSDNYVYQ